MRRLNPIQSNYKQIMNRSKRITGGILGLLIGDDRNYELVVKHAISLDKDTDTTACIAGGIAGIRDGIDAIPDRWRKQLRGQEILQPLLDRLLSHSL
jgi:ADP-ribosylglycohydrolase